MTRNNGMRTNCCWTDLSLVSGLSAQLQSEWPEIGTILTHLKITPPPPICHHLTSSRLYLAPSNFLNDDWDAQRIVQCLIYLVRRVNVCDTNLDSIYSLGSMYLPNTRIHYLLSMFSPRDKLSLLDLGCFQKLLSGDIFCRLNTNEWNVRGEQTLQGSELWESELLEDIYSQTLYQLPSPRR